MSPRATASLRTPAAFRRFALAALVTNVGIVLTGGAVRLTGSGLGCPRWPTCDGTRVLPGGAGDATWHQAIEFGNRLLTFVVLAAAVGTYLAARRAAADRPEVRRLAALLPLGVVAQAVLGGITVLTGLHPLTVAAHFLLSAALIGVAVLVHDRARRLDPAVAAGDRREVHTAAHPLAPHTLRRLVSGLIGVAAAVLVLGTLVTASGPHAGDPGTVRLGLDIRDIARVHAGAVWVTVALTVAIWWLAHRAGDRSVTRAAATLLGVEVAQGAVGYTQYALGVPAWLVSLHLLLACLFWIAALRVGLAARAAAPAGGPVAADRAPATVA